MSGRTKRPRRGGPGRRPRAGILRVPRCWTVTCGSASSSQGRRPQSAAAELWDTAAVAPHALTAASNRPCAVVPPRIDAGVDRVKMTLAPPARDRVVRETARAKLADVKDTPLGRGRSRGARVGRVV